MRNNRDDVIELLEAVQQAVMNATADGARSVRARLGAILRDARAGATETIAHLSDTVLAESDFLLDMAWTPETSDPALFESQRRRFAVAMDRLIYELGVTRIRPSTPMGERHMPKIRVPTPDRISLGRIRLAAILAEWVRMTRGAASWPTPSNSFRRAQLRSTRPQDTADNRS
jgi:hypothetical protein